jgi:hypothetical protein
MVHHYPRSRWSPRLAVVGAGAALVLALAGCGGAAEQPMVATAQSPGASPAAATSGPSGPVARYVAQQRDWVKCLREQGFDVPDPDARGQVDLRRPGAPSKTDPKWRATQQKCGSLLTLPVPTELEERPKLTAQEIQHHREYARCMRENGLPDWPDPGPDGNWPERQPGAPTEQEAAAMFRAGQICEPLLDGRPKGTPNPNATGGVG